MNIDDVKALAEILCTSGLSAIEVGEGESRIRIERELSAAWPAQSTIIPAQSTATLAQPTVIPAQSTTTLAQSFVIPANAPAQEAAISRASTATAAAVPDGSVGEAGQLVDFNRLIEVKSPLVGVYYSAPSPDDETFVSIGSKVKKGDVLCIIETMKLMNEILAEQEGEIVDICIKNGDIAEYGQVLFKMF